MWKWLEFRHSTQPITTAQKHKWILKEVNYVGLQITIKMILKYFDKEIFRNTAICFRPELEHCTPVWLLHLTHIDLLEEVQRRATKTVPEVKRKRSYTGEGWRPWNSPTVEVNRFEKRWYESLLSKFSRYISARGRNKNLRVRKEVKRYLYSNRLVEEATSRKC